MVPLAQTSPQHPDQTPPQTPPQARPGHANRNSTSQQRNPASGPASSPPREPTPPTLARDRELHVSNVDTGASRTVEAEPHAPPQLTHLFHTPWSEHGSQFTLLSERGEHFTLCLSAGRRTSAGCEQETAARRETSRSTSSRPGQGHRGLLPATWSSYGSQGRQGAPSSLLKGATRMARH